jgi:hypothetical protein
MSLQHRGSRPRACTAGVRSGSVTRTREVAGDRWRVPGTVRSSAQGARIPLAFLGSWNRGPPFAGSRDPARRIAGSRSEDRRVLLGGSQSPPIAFSQSSDLPMRTVIGIDRYTVRKIPRSRDPDRATVRSADRSPPIETAVYRSALIRVPRSNHHGPLSQGRGQRRPAMRTMKSAERERESSPSPPRSLPIGTAIPSDHHRERFPSVE